MASESKITASPKAPRQKKRAPRRQRRPDASALFEKTTSKWDDISALRKLREFRLDYGLSQQMMADLIGVSVRRLSALENAGTAPKKSSPSYRNVIEAIQLLQILADIVQRDFIATWLDQPIKPLDGLTPLEAIKRGNVARIWEILYRVGSGMPT